MLRLIALGLVLFAVGCAKKEEEEELAPPSSLFETEDLEQGHSQVESEESIVYTIGGQDAFYATAPTYTSTAGTFDACREERMAAVKASADTVNLSIKADLDLTDCPAPEAGTGSTITLSKVIVKIRFWVGCPDGDIEDYDGKTMAELEELEDSCGEKIDHETLVNLDFVQEYTQTGTYDDEAQTPYSMTAQRHLMMATQTATGKPCSLAHDSGAYTFSDKCESVFKYVSTSAMEGSSSSYTGESYSKAAFRSVTMADAGEPVWYSSGSMEATINNWTGTVTYSAADAAPTYTFTDGTSTVEGTVGQVGSGLRGRGHGSIAARIRSAVAQGLQFDAKPN